MDFGVSKGDLPKWGEFWRRIRAVVGGVAEFAQQIWLHRRMGRQALPNLRNQFGDATRRDEVLPNLRDEFGYAAR
jgi:hypothetical protein